MQSESFISLLVKQDGVILAMAMGCGYDSWKYAPNNENYTLDIPDSFYLDYLAVDPRLRGKGIGTKMLEILFGKVKDAGFKRVLLYTEIENPAQRLYERTGFHSLAKFKTGFVLYAKELNKE